MHQAGSLGLSQAIINKDVMSAEDFAAMFQAHRLRIFRFALASLRDRDAAESVTQDCFLRGHKALGQFRGESNVQTWLTQIAINLVRDAARSRRFQFWKRARASAVAMDKASDWIPAGGMSQEDRVIAQEQVDAIWSVLDGLSERQRTVFLLHFMEEMNANEIEAATGITKDAVKVHLFRAVHAVRKKLKERK